MTQLNRIDSEPAFLLSATPWRDTSLLAGLFSRDYGRVVVVARSARKRQSELRGVLVPFVPVQVAWYGKEELKTLHRAEWLGGWPQPQGRALFSGLYLNELVWKLTAREDPHTKLYDALAEAHREICTRNNHVAALRRFEWRLLTELGYAPDLLHDTDGAAVEAEKQYLLQAEQAPLLLASAPNNANGITASGSTLLQLHAGRFDNGESLQQALQITRMLLDFRLPEGIKSRRILQQIQAFQTA